MSGPNSESPWYRYRDRTFPDNRSLVASVDLKWLMEAAKRAGIAIEPPFVEFGPGNGGETLALQKVFEQSPSFVVDVFDSFQAWFEERGIAFVEADLTEIPLSELVSRLIEGETQTVFALRCPVAVALRLVDLFMLADPDSQEAFQGTLIVSILVHPWSDDAESIGPIVMEEKLTHLSHLLMWTKRMLQEVESVHEYAYIITAQTDDQ